MLAKKIIKLRNSEKMQKIDKLLREAERLLEKNQDDYTECIEMFQKIFSKLASRKKIIDVNLTKDDNRKIVLHQFGLFLDAGTFSKRCKKISGYELFQFLSENSLDVFDKVAEEIKYKNTRITFRDYCRIVSLFLKDNGITEIINRKNFYVKIKCRRPFVNVEDEKTEKIESIGIYNNDYGKVHFEIDENANGKNFELGNARRVDNIYIIEQFQNEIIKGLSKIIKMIRGSNNGVNSQELYRRLNDRFSAYLVANQI